MMRKKTGAVAIAFAFSLSTTSAFAYSEENAKFVSDTNNRAILKYIVCLESKMRNPASIGDALSKAEKSCEKLKAKISPADAEDIELGIMECGFKPGDADTC